MNLDKRDVEAVAKSRVNRQEGNKQTYYVGAALIVMIAGVLVARNSQMIGILLALGGFAIFIWYMYSVSKKQNVAKSKLLREWREEQNEQELGVGAKK